MGPKFLRKDGSVFFHACLDGEVHGMSLSCSNKYLFPLIYELDRFPELNGKPAGAEVLGVHVYLLTETSTHFGFDNPNLAFRYLKRIGQVPPKEKRDLG